MNLQTYLNDTDAEFDKLRAELFNDGINIPRSKKLYELVHEKIQKAVTQALEATKLDKISYLKSQEDTDFAHFGRGYNTAYIDQHKLINSYLGKE